MKKTKKTRFAIGDNGPEEHTEVTISLPLELSQFEDVVYLKCGPYVLLSLDDKGLTLYGNLPCDLFPTDVDDYLKVTIYV